MNNADKLPKIIAISGSTRLRSSNLSLMQAIATLYEGRLQMTIFNELANIPCFNPDHDTDDPPQSVSRFRHQLRQADGILICTPEYAMGVPGSLKNAIDWTVSSMEFSHKPTALITASSQGQKGHFALMETLRVIESEIPSSSQLVISFVQTKIKDNQIIDIATLEQVRSVMDSLILTIKNNP